MTVKLGSNIASLRAIRQLDKVSNTLGSVYERLASGQRINSASDDAAGLSITSKLSTDSRVFNQALRNINDSISALSIVDGALGELSKIVTRQAELAEQSANGVLTNKQRYALDSEYNALVKEFNRIIETTGFNGVNYLKEGGRELNVQAGYGIEGVTTISIGSELARTVGDGTFQSSSFITNNTYSFVTGDFNQDGILDLVGTSTSTNTFYEGDGSGGFTSRGTVSPAGGAENLEVGDFDGDGILDIISQNDTTISVYNINNQGNFFLKETINGSSIEPNLNSVADINNDGIDDYTYKNNNDDLVLLLGSSSGFKENSVFSIENSVIGYNRHTFGDVDGNGFNDLLITTNSSVVLHYNNGDGTFSDAVNLNINHGFSDISAIDVSDLNQDGLLDIAIQEFESNSKIFIQNADGTYQNTSTYTHSQHNITLGDINGDGIDDVAINGNDGLNVDLNNQSGVFTQTFTDSLRLQGDLKQLDVNGDGAIDIIAEGSQNIYLYLANTQEVTTIAFDSIKTQREARESLEISKDALNRINKERSSIGASMTRLETQTNQITTQRDMLIEAKSRIEDADIAVESANLVKSQILQQTVARVLQLTNLEPQLALSLLA